MLRIFCMLGLLVLGAPIGHAGMVIDDFTGTPTGATRTASGFFKTPDTSGGDFDVAGDVYSTLDYSFASSQDFLGNTVISLADFALDAPIKATLTINGTTTRSKIVSSPGEVKFAFNSGDLSDVSTMEFVFQADPFGPSNSRDFSFSSVQAVPEPTSIALVGLAGLGGLAVRRRRKAANA